MPARRDARAVATIAVVVCVVVCVGRGGGATALTLTSDGRTCKFPLEVGGATSTTCVPFGSNDVLWCVAEEDGRWGTCAEAYDASERGRVTREMTLRAARTLGDSSASADEKRAANEILENASALMLRALADENIEIDGTVIDNPIAAYLEKRDDGVANGSPPPIKRLRPPPPTASSPPPSPPPSSPPPSSPPPSPPPVETLPRCRARVDIRWESPQADGSSEFGVDVYVLLSSGDSISDGWRVIFKFMSDQVALYSNSAYGADARTLYSPDYGRVYELADRGWDAFIALYSTKRIGFNVRTRADSRALKLKLLILNGARCDVVEESSQRY